MTPPSPEFYSQWRDARLTEALHDTPSSPPPERLLQAIWQHQRLHRDALQTIEGLPLRVLHPGFLNHEAGPDFYQAVIQVGENPPAAGDVEVDPLATDWYSHGHATNPAFAGVILHVIWNGPAKTALPTLRIQPHSDAPIKDLAAWQETEPPYPVEYTGQCYAPLSKLTLDSQDNLLRQAALVRLKTKSESFTRLAHCHGWDAALWRGLFRALGYKHNTWPMQNLAERLPALRALGPTNSCGWQARLLGLSGLLTDDLPGQTPASRQPSCSPSCSA